MVATCHFSADRVEVSSVDVDDDYVAGQSDYAAQLLDFLIKSHMSRWQVAHPMPQSWLGKSAEELATLSFGSFGRLGLFGTFESTIGVPSALIDSF
jgi:hypothetical protein